jgi:hypothetical protein
MEAYQASYVQDEYERSRHMGQWYELAFRDLYPAPPASDCQHTTKYGVSDVEYDEDFRFDVVEYGVTIPCMSIIAMNDTSVPLVVDQVMTETSAGNFTVPDTAKAPTVFHTTIIAFSRDEAAAEEEEGQQQQYEWVVEFTCGSNGSAAMQMLFPNGFVGLNMYSKSGPHTPQAEQNLASMMSAVEGLGLDWAMDPEAWRGMDSGFNIVPHGPACSYLWAAVDSP